MRCMKASPSVLAMASSSLGFGGDYAIYKCAWNCVREAVVGRLPCRRSPLLGILGEEVVADPVRLDVHRRDYVKTRDLVPYGQGGPRSRLHLPVRRQQLCQCARDGIGLVFPVSEFFRVDGEGASDLVHESHLA